MRQRRILVATLAVTLWRIQVASAVTIWTGAAGNQLWTDAGNWSAGVPGLTNLPRIADATIDLSGGQSSTSIDAAGTVNFINGVLSLNRIQTSIAFGSPTPALTLGGQFTGQAANSGLAFSGSFSPIYFTGTVVPFGGTTTFTNSFIRSDVNYAGALQLTNSTIDGNGKVESTSVGIGIATTLDNTNAAISDRLSPSAALTGTGRFTLIGNASAPLLQRVASLNLSGTAGVAVIANGASTQLHAASVNLSPGAQLRIDLSGVGARFTTDIVPASIGGGSAITQRSIVTNAISGDVSASGGANRGFVTYDTTQASGTGAAAVVGYRALRDDEYVLSPAGANPLDNVLLPSSATLGGNSTVNSIVLASAGDLDLQGHNLVVTSGKLLQRNTVATDAGAGAVIRSSIAGGSVSSSNALTVFGDGFTGTNSRPFTIAASINAPALSIAGGNVRLEGVNTLPGGVTIASPSAVIGRGEALGAGPLTMQTNVAFSGDQTLANALNVQAGTATSNGLSSTAYTASVEAGRTVTFNGKTQVIGSLNGGSGTLRLSGGGTVVGSLGSSSNVSSKIELGGTWTYAPNVSKIFDGYGQIFGNATTPMSFHTGTISAGAENQVGTMTLGTLRESIFSETATVIVEVSGGVADRLIVTRAPTDSSFQPKQFVLNVRVLAPAAYGTNFTIIQNDTAVAAINPFNGLPENALLTAAGGSQFRVSYIGGDGNDVTLTAVPEPSTLAAIGVSLLVWRRRRSVS